jgi:2,3-bisphosphoglycerate-dependent phosphoglycerate mutase
MKIVEAYGERMVGEWRRSYVIAPPKVFEDDPRHPSNDKRYRDVDPALLPKTENLGDVLLRVNDLFEREIKGQLLAGKRLLIVCHGSPIRAWTNILMKLGEDESRKFNVPNAIPLVLDLNRQNLSVEGWRLLGDADNIREKMVKLEK